jgi:hypothetical protein
MHGYGLYGSTYVHNALARQAKHIRVNPGQVVQKEQREAQPGLGEVRNTE